MRLNFCTSTRVPASFCPKIVHHERSLKQQEMLSEHALSSLTVPQLLFLIKLPSI